MNVIAGKMTGTAPMPYMFIVKNMYHQTITAIHEHYWQICEN